MKIQQIKTAAQLIKFLSTNDVEGFAISDNPVKDKSALTKYFNSTIEDNRFSVVIKVKN